MHFSLLSELLKSHGTLKSNESWKKVHERESQTIDETLMIWFKQARSVNILNFGILVSKVGDFLKN
jgi:hypothetical protein